jgi:hypothetical protein
VKVEEVTVDDLGTKGGEGVGALVDGVHERANSVSSLEEDLDGRCGGVSRSSGDQEESIRCHCAVSFKFVVSLCESCGG